MSIMLATDGGGDPDEITYFDNAEIFEVIMKDPSAGKTVKKKK